MPSNAPAGPDPVDKPAAFNPYTPDGASPPSSQSSVASGQVTSPLTTHHSPPAGYAVHPNPAIISHPVSQPRPPTHGVDVGKRVVGSERVYTGLAYGFELLKGLLVLLILAILTHLFVATIFRISGESMLPNFADGQFILVDKLSYLMHPPLRGDVVVIQFPGDPEHRKFIKRVIGLPGEKVEVSGGVVYVDDRLTPEVYLPEGLITESNVLKVLRSDEYFLMGDNRPNSNDSRFFGPVPIDKFIGKSQAILSGTAWGWVTQPAF